MASPVEKPPLLPSPPSAFPAIQPLRVHRLRKIGIIAEQQHPIQVFDEDSTSLGDFFADLFVNECLIVELKACRALCDDHVAQLLGYLKASRIEHGLLINFGAPKLEIRKYALTPL